MKSRSATKTTLIGRVPGVRGGDPTVLGTRISVQDIVEWAQVKYEEMGFVRSGEPMPPLTGLFSDERKREAILEWMLANFPRLTHERVLAAWQYFLDHRDEILTLIAEDDAVWRAHE